MEPVSKDSDGEAEEENAEDTDSDAAPEEATITAGKEEALKREDSVRSSVNRRRQQIKEKRKQQHEKNKLQQEEKVCWSEIFNVLFFDHRYKAFSFGLK